MQGVGVQLTTLLARLAFIARPSTRALAVRLLRFMLLGTPLLAQSSPPLKIEVREVTVDITVYDGNGYTRRGEPVSGLHQGDFAVYEDGKRRSIESFVEHHGASAADESPAPTLILFDLANTNFDSQAWTRTELKRFLRNVPPGSPIAIAALTPGLCFVHGFTPEPSVLLAAFDKVGDCTHIRPSPFLESDGEQRAFQRQASQIRDAAVRNPQVAGMADQLERMHDSMLAVQAQQRTTNTLSAFEALAHYLAVFPGRKNLVWLAQSFTTRPFGRDTEENEDFQRVASLLAEARVAVYPIDDGGLVAPHARASVSRMVNVHSAEKPADASNDANIEGSLQRSGFMATMDILAERTGGEAFYNTNRLDLAMSRVVNQASDYYTLTYAPEVIAKSKPYHRIAVHLTRDIGTHRLAYRQGYFSSDKPESALDALLDPGMPTINEIHYRASVRRTNSTFTPDPIGDSSLLLRMMAEPPRSQQSTVLAGDNHSLAQNRTGKVRRFFFDLAVALPDLRLEAGPDGTEHGSLEFGVIAYDLEGKPVNWIRRGFNPSLSATDRDQMGKVGLQLSESLDLPPGKYMVRLGIYDEFSGHATTSDTALDNPDHL